MKTALDIVIPVIRDAILDEFRADPLKFVDVPGLEWTSCNYSDFEMGPFTWYYELHLTDEKLDIWSVECGIICHEFGGSEIHKCIGQEAAEAAANNHFLDMLSKALGGA